MSTTFVEDKRHIIPVTLVADMTEVGQWYELTVQDGAATTGLYAVAEDTIPKQLANF